MSATSAASAVEVCREYAAGIDAPCPIPAEFIEYLVNTEEIMLLSVFIFKLKDDWSEVLVVKNSGLVAISWIQKFPVKRRQEKPREFCTVCRENTETYTCAGESWLDEKLHRRIHEQMLVRYDALLVRRAMVLGTLRVLRCPSFFSTNIHVMQYRHPINSDYTHIVLFRKHLFDHLYKHPYPPACIYLEYARHRALRIANRYIRPLTPVLSNRHAQLCLLRTILRSHISAYELDNLHELMLVLQWSLDKGVRSLDPDPNVWTEKFASRFHTKPGLIGNNGQTRTKRKERD